MLTQISKREGRIDRVPRGTQPIIELHTEPNEYITSVTLRECDPKTIDDLSRKTRDWEWTAYVVTPLGQVA